MRDTARALALALVAAIGVLTTPGGHVTPAAAASTDPKVVIIVGAVHGQTDSFRQSGDAAYNEAIKYTRNVVKVYSPNATWAKVKAAAQGASILIYMGHGNGFPSPYRTTPWPYSQNGFGLNAAAGQGDYNNQYYGEYYIGNEIKLAPNAVVILHRLCYAGGNGEPGAPTPTASVAKQRVDNYAAGFLKAGARSVVVDGLMGPAYYIRSLFTTRQSVDQMWRNAPNFHGNDFRFASVRSPGYTVEMDPGTPAADYYRALTGRLDLRTDEVTGGGYASTDVNPGALAVPGNAAVATDGAGLYPDATLTPDPGTGSAPETLAADTRVRVLAAAGTTEAGVPAYQVETFDGSSSGYMAGPDLAPRDSTAPRVWESAVSAPAFSPNADGRQDTTKISGRFSEGVDWTVDVKNGDGTTIFTSSGSGTDFTATWDGTTGGSTVPDGAYTWTVRGTDAWGNGPATKTGSLLVDTVAPELAGMSIAAVTPALAFSPNGDGKTDTASISFATNEAGAIDLVIKNDAGTTVRSTAAAVKAGAGSITWDGKSTGGTVVPDGLYTARFSPRDAAGNVGQAGERLLGVYASLSKVATSTTIFYPQDGDRLSKTATLSFALARPATVTWRITTLGGTVVRTIKSSEGVAAGAQSFVWNGRDDGGALVARGTYASVVTASNGTVGATQKTWVELNAFSFKVSDSTPARGQTITITTTSAELLKGAPSVRISQPGIAAWSVRMTLVSGRTYKATLRLKASSKGAVTFRISALDADGRWQATYRSLPLG